MISFRQPFIHVFIQDHQFIHLVNLFNISEGKQIFQLILDTSLLVLTGVSLFQK